MSIILFTKTFSKTIPNTTKTARAIFSLSQSRPLNFQSAAASPTRTWTRTPTRTITTMSSAMAKRLEGKTILITGASSGIGRSCAFEFARTAPKDLKLVLTARRADRLAEIAAQIREEVGEGVQVLPVALDVSDPKAVRGFVAGLPEGWRGVDVLVNNAYVASFFLMKGG